MFCENYDSFLKELERRHFIPHSAANGAEAKELALSLIGSGKVGCGGSVTVRDMGLPDALRAQGAEVYFHWEHDAARRPEIFQKAAAADWYLASSNAITRDAKLINIDGTGNRVAGMFSGPKKVLLIIGKNKFAETLEGAMARVKDVACPLNGKRLDLPTPCAATGKCANCYSPRRMCSVTTIIEAKPGLLEELHLILVDEELGY